MLEEVSKAGTARSFVFRPDVVPNLHVDHRRIVVFNQQRTQSILEENCMNTGARKLDR